MSESKSLFEDARGWLETQANEVESLISGMPREKRIEYLAGSKPHAALRVFGDIPRHLEAISGEDGTLAAHGDCSICDWMGE